MATTPTGARAVELPPLSLTELTPLAADADVGEYDAFGRKVSSSDADKELQQRAYRQQYRWWRLGHHKGCVTNSAPWGEQRAAVIVQQLSPWDRPPSEEALSFRHTMSYYVCMTFMVGAMLFVVGCGADLLNNEHGLHLNYIQARDTVDWPFLVGSSLFLLGSYAGLLEVLNVGKEDEGVKMIYWRSCPDQNMPFQAFWANWAFLVGATFFQVNVMAALYDKLPGQEEGYHWASREYLWGPATIGSIFFVIGSAFEVNINGGLLACRWTDLAWCSAMQDLLGSLLFLTAAGIGLYYGSGESVWGTKVPYLAGSALFLTASMCNLWLWKTEQYGLSFARPLNKFVGWGQDTTRLGQFDGQPDEDHDSRKRKVQIWSLAAIFSYAVGLVASVVDLCFVSSALEKWPRYLLDSVAVVFLFIGVVVLASVIHLNPLRQPYRNLLFLLRFIMILFTVNKTWEAVRSVRRMTLPVPVSSLPRPPFPLASTPVTASYSRDTAQVVLVVRGRLVGCDGCGPECHNGAQ